MHHFSTFILLIFAAETFADEAPLLPVEVLRSDLEGLISIYSWSSTTESVEDGFLQYASYELFVERDDKQQNNLVITCAKEGSKCKYYDNVQHTWKETISNKILFNGDYFFDMFEVIRVKFVNEFLLLLTIEKTDRLRSNHLFFITYKTLPDFLEEDEEIFKQDRTLVDLKAIYVDDSLSDYLKPHPVFRSMPLVDARLKKEGESVTVVSSSGIVQGSRLLAIRTLGPHEYIHQYARQDFNRGNPVTTINPGLVKKDLAILDPENKCQKKQVNFVGFLEYKKKFRYEVRCYDKKYDVTTRVKYNRKEFDATITCPTKTSSGKNHRCTLKEITPEDSSRKCGAVHKKLSDGDRLELVSTEKETMFESIAKITGLTLSIVHYFQLDNFFKNLLHTMNKMLRINQGNDCKINFVMPSFGRQDITVPISFDCQYGVVEIGRGGAFDVFDNESTELVTVEKLAFNLETNEFESPSLEFGQRDSKAIRFAGKWQPVPTLKKIAKANIIIDHIIEDLKILREQYLEEAAVDPESRLALKVNGDVLLVIQGETMINDEKAVVINTLILCEFSFFKEVYFTGQKLFGYDYATGRMKTVYTDKCYVQNKNLEGEHAHSVQGLLYLTEDDLAEYMKSFTSLILSRCQWYHKDTVFRFVIQDPDRWPVLEGLFHCDLQLYHFKRRFKVLSMTRSQDVVDYVFVFVREELLVTSTDAYAVRLLDGETIDAGLMGPPIMIKEKWAIALQVVSA